jgi:hypothetical protein
MKKGTSERGQKTHMQLAMMAINTGTPTPTLMPMMTLLLFTPPVASVDNAIARA